MKGTVHIVAELSARRAELARAAFAAGYHAELYDSYDELLHAKPNSGVILAEDAPGRGGVSALLAGMSQGATWCPVVATSREVDLRRVVIAIRNGATDYLAPTIDVQQLDRALHDAREDIDAKGAGHREAIEARRQLAKLTPRELDVLDHLVRGLSNKEIALQLQLSPRTVEVHRANMMSKLGANHSVDLIRCRLAAGDLANRKAIA